MIYLLISIISIFAGIAAVKVVRPRGPFLAALDGLILAIVAIVVLSELIPHGFATAGIWGAFPLVLGVILPGWWSRHLARNTRTSGASTTVLGAIGLLSAHAVLDGAALSLAHDDHFHAGDSMILAVLVHRLPVGILLAWLAPPSWPHARIWGVAMLVAAMTAIGYVAGPASITQLSSMQLGLFELLLAGVLMHVVIEPPDLPNLNPVLSRRASALGFLTGLGVMLLMMHAPKLPRLFVETGDHTGVLHGFIALALESAPALLLAFVAAGFLRAFWSSGIRRLLAGPSASIQALKGMAFGLPLPVCSCGVVPLYEGLVRSGAPLAAALAFLVATPEIGIGALLLSFPLLGVEMTLFRVGAAVVAAFVVALITVRFATLQPSATGGASLDLTPSGGAVEKLKAGMRYGLRDLVEDVMPWVVVGLLAASLLEPVLAVHSFATMPAAYQVPLAAIAGLPVYVCASGSTPLVAVLLAGGLSPGAGIAFLLTGPATNVVTFGVLSRLHGRAAALAFGIAMVGLSCLIGLAVDLIPPALGGVAAGTLHDHPHMNWLPVLCLCALAVVTGAGLFRLGVRGVLGKLTQQSTMPVDSGAGCCDVPSTAVPTCCESTTDEAEPTTPAAIDPAESTGCCH